MVADTSAWLVLMSGPLAQRSGLAAQLATDGVEVLPLQSKGPRSWGLPDDDPTVGWLQARVEHPDHLLGTLERAGWQVRIHRPDVEPAATKSVDIEELVTRVRALEKAREQS